MTTEPMNPLAGVSGPSKFAVRTDKLEMGSTAYGEGKDTQAILSASELSKSKDVSPARAGDVREAAAQGPVTELFAPTQRPNESITAGINRGEGPGANALGMTKITVKLSDSLAAMLPYDTTGEIAVLYQEALSRGN
jgi:hypothetical protein